MTKKKKSFRICACLDFFFFFGEPHRYVVGLGDRHNDNIMVTKHGHLFHIDFAHFLGNVMKFGIYTRERAPFVFTPEFLFVMGGETSEMYAQFKELCCQCYNVLRAHSNTFISLFALVRPIITMKSYCMLFFHYVKLLHLVRYRCC